MLDDVERGKDDWREGMDRGMGWMGWIEGGGMDGRWREEERGWEMAGGRDDRCKKIRGKQTPTYQQNSTRSRG